MSTPIRFISKYGLDGNSLTITNVADPVNAQDVVTKNFSTNASNLSSGTVPSTRLPAFTGDATSTAGTSALTLASTGVAAGTYCSVTVDVKGRVTGGTNPTTLSGYGITDAQALNSILTGISGLSTITTGLIKVTNGSVSFDTNSYITGNQTITVSGDATGSGTTALSLTLASTGVTSGSYGSSTAIPVITVDSKGRITAASTASIISGTTSVAGIVQLSSSTSSTSTTLAATPSAVKAAYDLANAAIPSTEKGVANGVATLDATGLIPTSQLPSYVDDVLEFATLASFPATGSLGVIYVALDTNYIYRWSGSIYIRISSAVSSADTATSLATARSIAITGDGTWSVTFDGSANVSGALTLANSGATAGTYNNNATQVRPFTIDAKGRVTSIGTAVTITPAWSSITSKPTTISGYGITDAQSTISGAATTITTSNLTASRAIVSDASGKIAVSAVTSTELGYLSGVTSAVQTQISAKEPSITAGTTAQYWRGDKTWQTLSSSTIGLGNVENTALSTWSGSTNISTAGNLTVSALTTSGTISTSQAAIVNTTLTTATTAANQVVGSISATVYRSAEIYIQATSGTSYHTTKLLVVHDGTAAYVTEWGTIFTSGSLGSFDVDINTGNIRLLVTPTNASTVIRAHFVALKI